MKTNNQLIKQGRLKTLLIILIVITGFKAGNAQAPSIQWSKALGGSQDDEGRCVQQTTDGGYIVAGSSSSTNGDVSGNHGDYDFWIVKLNNAGVTQWQKSYGGSQYDYLYSIKQSKDGGFIAAGFTYSNDGDVVGLHLAYDTGSYTPYNTQDAWIIKLDASGNLQWQKALGGSGSDLATAIDQTTDGGYVMTGSTNSTDGDATGNTGTGSNTWIVKLNGSGTILWKKFIDNTNKAFLSINSLAHTADGGTVLAGNLYGDSLTIGGLTLSSQGYYDYCVVKLDDVGNIQWGKTMGGSNYDEANSVVQTSDGYIVAGISYSNDGNVSGNHGNGDYWVVKLDNTGSIQWSKSLGGSNYDYGEAINQTSDGGYIVAGYSGSTDGDVTGNKGGDDYWIVKLYSFGSIQWEKSLGGSGYDYALAVQQTSDEGYIVAGISSSTDGDVIGKHAADDDYWVVKLAGRCTQIISGPTTGVCANTTKTYNLDPDTNLFSIKWSVTSNMTITKGQGTHSVNVKFGSLFTSGTLTTTATNLCGTTTVNTVITAKPAAPGAIRGPASGVCHSTQMYSIPPVNGAGNYTWTAPANAVIDSGQGTSVVRVVFGTSFTTGTLIVKVTNPCGANAVTSSLAIGSLPVKPGAINGSANAACNTTFYYYLNSVFSVTDYVWNTPPNASIQYGQGTNYISINFNSAYTTGVITVQAFNACGATGSSSITVNAAPHAPGVISGAASACPGNSEIYTIAPVHSAVSYTWTAPANATITAGQGTDAVTVFFKSTYRGGTLTVRAQGLCGLSGASSKSIARQASCRMEEEPVEVEAETFTVYPNPAHDKLNVVFNSTLNNNYLIRMFDMTGRQMLSSAAGAQEGGNHVALDLSNLSKGIYIISLEMEGADRQVIRVALQ